MENEMAGYYHYPPPPPLPDARYPPYYPAAPPPPAYLHHHHYPAAAPPPPPGAGFDEVRTLFVAGLPDDVKLRELYNLFSEFPGFESSQIKSASQAFGFVVFSDQQSALAAMHALNGMTFDLEKGSTLYIDLAKSNSRSKRSRADNSGPVEKRIRGSTATSRGFLDPGIGSNFHMPGMENTAHTNPSTQSLGNIHHQEANDSDHNRSLSSYTPQNTAPCATLFVANLGRKCTEPELTQAFARCPGFIKLKMQHKLGAPVAFVDFKDIESSTGAINSLQGTLLRSSDGEGMRLEYAKARMGSRKREKRR